MDQPGQPSGDRPAWQGDEVPCVYCGQTIARTEERCPHCRTSFSLAVRKASRDILGSWYYLDPRNLSGRGVTFETLIKMIEKGRIRPDSIVRGPTTHQDWMFAAEAPRLAKYLGMCPHCFGEAKPEDTYCTRCQLDMNSRPAEPRPGVPADLVKEPYQKAAYEMEKQLAAAAAAEAATSAAPAPSPAAAGPAPAETQDAPQPAPRGETIAAFAAAAMADTSPAAGERLSRVAVAARRKPKLWVVLALTWATLIPILLIWFLAVPKSWKDALMGGMSNLTNSSTTVSQGPTPIPPKVADEWLNEQLRLEQKAEEDRNYGRAIEIYKAIYAKTGDATFENRRRDLERKIDTERRQRVAKLSERLKSAEDLAKDHDYETALKVTDNISQADREFLKAQGVSVEKMEATFRSDQAKWKQQEDQLATKIGVATQMRASKQWSEALDVYKQIRASFPADMVRKYIADLDKEMQDCQTQIAAAKLTPTPPTPDPTVSSKTPEQIAADVADVLIKVAALEKKEDFTKALELLESIKTKFDRKFWPDTLEDRIRLDKGKEEALKFFGMEGTKKDKKTP